MKRDMDLIREILLKAEELYVDTAINDLTIDGYDMATVAYHCKLLHNAGYIFDYKAQYASNEIYTFAIGALTWAGNEYLEKIRDNSRWGKIKNTLIQKGLPFTIDMVKSVADAFITAAAEGVTKGILNGSTSQP